ncbi:MAG: hypothetical protein LZF86_50053 [Nitrospira sp.]|nr:MAG: hypothetical protein LZF86_50053 [Nitrospira sp.]
MSAPRTHHRHKLPLTPHYPGTSLAKYTQQELGRDVSSRSLSNFQVNRLHLATIGPSQSYLN